MARAEDTEIHVEREERVHDAGSERRERAPGPAPVMDVREEDLEPHAGLRYIARLFKVLAILLILLLIAELIIGVVTEGSTAIPTLLVEATRLIVFAGLLWGLADMALMLIESNHDLRATRILVGRLNGRVQNLASSIDRAADRPPPPPGAALPPRADRPDRP